MYAMHDMIDSIRGEVIDPRFCFYIYVPSRSIYPIIRFNGRCSMVSLLTITPTCHAPTFENLISLHFS
jgi:hypothetical protein